MVCPKCGNQLPHNAAFCSRCGAQVAQGAGQKTVMQNSLYEEPKSKSVNLLAIFAVVLVAIVAVAGVLMFGGAKEAPVESAPAVMQEETAAPETAAATEENTESAAETEAPVVDTKVTITYLTSVTTYGKSDEEAKKHQTFEYPEDWTKMEYFTVNIWTWLAGEEGQFLLDTQEYSLYMMVHNYKTQDAQLESTTIVYDGKGRADILCYTYSDDYAMSTGHKEVQYYCTYPEDTNLLLTERTIIKDADGNDVLDEWKAYTYQEQDGGYVREISNGTYSTLDWFDADGRQITQTQYVGEEVTAYAVCSYDEHGNMVCQEFFDNEGRTEKIVCTYDTIEVDKAFAEMHPGFKPVN